VRGLCVLDNPDDFFDVGADSEESDRQSQTNCRLDDRADSQRVLVPESVTQRGADHAGNKEPNAKASFKA